MIVGSFFQVFMMEISMMVLGTRALTIREGRGASKKRIISSTRKKKTSSYLGIREYLTKQLENFVGLFNCQNHSAI